MAVIITENLQTLCNEAAKVKGDFVEVGVFVAETFHRLAPLANQHGRRAFAIDSFCGMDEPTEEDKPDGSNPYPKGRLTNGGVENFQNIMQLYGIDRDKYICVEGYVPKVLEKFDEEYPDTSFAFALIDLDHYKPTKDALDWIWDKVAVGGFLVLDDYFREKDHLASLAINEWIPENLHFMDYRVDALIDSQLYIRKLA